MGYADETQPVFYTGIEGFYMRSLTNSKKLTMGIIDVPLRRRSAVSQTRTNGLNWSSKQESVYSSDQNKHVDAVDFLQETHKESSN